MYISKWKLKAISNQKLICSLILKVYSCMVPIREEQINMREDAKNFPD